MGKDSDAKEEFILRLNGKIVPWALVILFFLLLGRALVAEFRIYQTEYMNKDQEVRLRVLEGIPPPPRKWKEE